MSSENDPSAELRESSNSTARSVNRLGEAAKRASQMAGILGEMPNSLTDLLGTTNAATRGLAFFETRFQVLQQLTTFGVNFGYSLKEMSLQANRAGLSLTDLANLVGNNSEQLASLGADADKGLNYFLDRQASMFSRQAKNLNEFGMTFQEQFRAFGLTQDQITKTAQDFETMYQTGRIADFRSNQERNRQMTDYFEVLDDLSRLTGKQRDQIADELAENSRKGQVQARAMLIDDPEMRQEYREQLGSMGVLLGDSFGALAEDILGPGSPQTRASADLSVAASEYTNLLYQARDALERGNHEEFTQKMNAAKVAAMGARNQENAQMAMYRNMSDFGNNIAVMFEDTYLTANQFARAREELEGRLGRSVSDIEVFADLQRQYSEARNQRQERFQNRDDLFGAMAGTSAEVFEAGMKARQTALTTAFKGTTEILQGLSTALQQLDLATALQNFQNDIDKFRAGLFGGASTEIAQQIATARQTALGLESDVGVALASQLSDIETRLNAPETTSTERSELEQQARDIIQAIRDAETLRIAQADNVTITEAKLLEINNLREALGLPPVDAPASPDNNSIGTLGNTGRLFKNFGQETLTALHGLEAVLTPDQLGHVVERTVAGALTGAAPAFGSGSNINISMPTELTNGLSTIDGRLNTIRNLPQMMAGNNEQTIDLTPLETAIMNLPARFKQPVEDALNSSLKPAMEQVASNTMRGAEFTERTFKNTRGISNDYMRGAT